MNAIANEARIAAGDEFYTTVDEMRFYYEHLETCDLAQDLFLAELDGALAGYARAAWHDEADLRAYEPIVFVDPTLDHEALYPALLDVALERIDQIAGGHPPGPKVARVEVTDASTRLEATVRQRGFLPVRTFYTMVRPTLDDLADAPLPDGIENRDVRPEHLRRSTTRRSRRSADTGARPSRPTRRGCSGSGRPVSWTPRCGASAGTATASRAASAASSTRRRTSGSAARGAGWSTSASAGRGVAAASHARSSRRASRSSANGA
jgi:hypothetical protein